MEPVDTMPVELKEQHKRCLELAKVVLLATIEQKELDFFNLHQGVESSKPYSDLGTKIVDLFIAHDTANIEDVSLVFNTLQDFFYDLNQKMQATFGDAKQTVDAHFWGLESKKDLFTLKLKDIAAKVKEISEKK